MRVLTLAKTDLNQYVAQSQKDPLRETRFDHYDINTVRNYLLLSHHSKNLITTFYSNVQLSYYILHYITFT